MKRKTFKLALCFFIVLTVAAGASAKAPPRSVLGLSPGMSEEAAHRVLRRVARQQKDEGKKEEEEGGRDEVWLLERHTDFAKVIVGFDAKNHVRYVTALAKEEGHRMSYSEVATLKDAKVEESGVFRRYTWEVKPGKKSRGYLIIAQGRDPQYLMSLSIKQRD
jgi:hypothetical protein